MARRGRLIFLAVTVAATLAAALPAQKPVEPMAYAVTMQYQAVGPKALTTTYRLGQKVVVDRTVPPEEAYGNFGRTHTRTLLNFETRRSLRWDPLDPSAPCVRSNFLPDDTNVWDNPFVSASDLASTDMKQVGTATLHGISAKVLQSTDDRLLAAKLWVDPRTGLILKTQFISPQTGSGRAYAEVTDFSLNAPPASIFQVPAQCDAFPVIPKTAKAPEGWPAPEGPLGIYAWNAVVGPASKNSCTMLFRVVGMGGKEWNTPMTSGIQVAVDLAATNESDPHYSARLDDKGQATFSGGELHEIEPEGTSGMYRIDNVPEQFVIDVEFGNNGSAAAKIYRQCFEPQSVLQYAAFPSNIEAGGTWEWVKPGMYPGLYPKTQH